jgi:hypothetical protein
MDLSQKISIQWGNGATEVTTLREALKLMVAGKIIPAEEDGDIVDFIDSRWYDEFNMPNAIAEEAESGFL